MTRAPTRRLGRRACALTALAQLACGGGGSGGDDGGATDRPTLAPCATAGSAYVITLAGERKPLSDGSPLGIILGFQGFQFANVGLVTADELPPLTDMESRVEVPGKVNRTIRHTEVKTEAAAGGFETETVIVYFNDVPLPELVGLDGTLELHAAGQGCLAHATVQVRLAEGGFQGPDTDAGADAGSDGP